MNHCIIVSLASLLLICGNADAGDSSPASTKFPITRDTWFSNVGREADGSNGGASHLKVKSIQEMALIDIDPATLKGHVVKSATLHVHLSGPEVLHRITVSSFGADWVEGDATSYAVKDGVSTFNHRIHPDVPWAYPGSNLTAVMLGQGGTIWRMAEASPPDEKGWQTIAIDPAVVAAHVSGISSGFLVFDDTGSEWSRAGEKFTLRQFPNRLFDSKDSNRTNAPYIEVALGETDDQPPAAPADLKSDTSDLPAGEAIVSWLTPADNGPAGAIGFFVDVDGKPVPRYLVPIAAEPSQRVTMHLRDLGLAGGQTVAVTVKAGDGAGNISAPASLQVKVSDEKVLPLPGKNAEPYKGDGTLPRLGEAQVVIIDTLDKVQPVTGRMVPPQEPAYLAANHLWDGKTIHLFAARNEIVSFQILMHGPIDKMSAHLEFDGDANHDLSSEFFGLGYVKAKNGPMPDPLISQHQQGTLSIPDPSAAISGQQYGSLICQILVSPGINKALEKGTLLLSAGGKDLKIPVELTVWDFALSDALSFIPEMNCYGLPDDEAGYYRLAHANRAVINRVPYHQNGIPAEGCAPIWNPKTRKLDWTVWDKRFGKYFDGSAFDNGDGDTRAYRPHVPLEVFYLPLCENWPTPMEGNYNGSYWADQAFPKSYRDDFVEVSRQFAEHFNEKGWDKTLFQCFFNGKNNFKQAGWSRGSCPWLLDEPANFQDYWAIKFFGDMFHTGVNLAPPGKAKLVFRADISRPEWQRDALDSVLDYNVVGGGAFHQYNRLVLDRKRQFHQIVIPYGGSNDPADSNIQPAAWCLESWMLGGDGVLPWQTIGEASSWKNADALSLFYPGEPAGLKEPAASIRLKSYLRGEQDVEYLTLLARVENQSRGQLARRVRGQLNLTGKKHGTGFTGGEDAGVIDFGSLRPQDLWAFRMRVGKMLNDAHPGQSETPVEFRTPPRDSAAGAPGYAK